MKNEVTTTGEQLPAQPADMFETIRQIALMPDANIDALERLVALQERTEEHRARREYAAAMSEAQGEIAPVVCESKNTQTNSFYAKLHQLDRTIRPIYTRHGFSLSFDEDAGANGETRYTAICRHAGGHVEHYHCDMALDNVGSGGKVNKTSVHAKKSSSTYARGILIARIFNVTFTGDPTDDDGNAAGRGAVLSQQEMEALERMLAQTGTDLEKFLRWAGVGDLMQFPKDKYGEAVLMLAKKGARSEAR